MYKQKWFGRLMQVLDACLSIALPVLMLVAAAVWSGALGGRPLVAETPTADETVVLLDSNMAFGTGEHETTSMCVAFLDKYAKSPLCILIPLRRLPIGFKTSSKTFIAFGIPELSTLKVSTRSIQLSGYFSAYSRIIFAVPSVEASS